MKNNDPFPKLTILNDTTPPPPAPRLSNSEKYGSLYWMGISGLIASILLVGWFGTNLWLMRNLWQAIFVLHSADYPEAQRIEAAEKLIADQRMESAQIQPMIFRKSIPEKARYLLAEHLDKALSAQDAGEMLKLITTTGPTSPPNWLRGHLTRLAATSLRADSSFPASSFEKLLTDSDPIVADWAAFGLIRSTNPNSQKLGMNRLDQRAKAGSALSANLILAKDGPSVASTLAIQQAIQAMRQETPQNRSLTQ